MLVVPQIYFGIAIASQLLHRPLLHAHRVIGLRLQFHAQRRSSDGRELHAVELIFGDSELVLSFHRLPLVAILIEEAPRSWNPHAALAGIVEPVEPAFAYLGRLYKGVLDCLLIALRGPPIEVGGMIVGCG